MGPSGSGKTTLLSIIGSRAQRSAICHAMQAMSTFLALFQLTVGAAELKALV